MYIKSVSYIPQISTKKANEAVVCHPTTIRVPLVPPTWHMWLRITAPAGPALSPVFLVAQQSLVTPNAEKVGELSLRNLIPLWTYCYIKTCCLALRARYTA